MDRRAGPSALWLVRHAESVGNVADAHAHQQGAGRLPSTAEAGVGPELALDGIDELLTGFFPRGRSELAGLAPITLAVLPGDAQRAWTVRVEGDRLTTVRERRPDPDATFTGTAAQLYLGLWNRGAEITATGRPGVLEAWRRGQRVSW